MTLAALDFWLTSGWHLCDRDSEGHLLAGTDFMTAYFQRPELALVEEYSAFRRKGCFMPS